MKKNKSKPSQEEIDSLEYYAFLGYLYEEEEKAMFNTKIASEMKHNGELVDVIGFIEGKDIYCDRYIVRFNDGTIDDNIMNIELNFDYSNSNERER